MALDVSNMTDEQLQEVIDNYRAASVEINSRREAKEEKERAEKEKAVKESPKFKKLVERYKKATDRIAGLAKKHELTVNLPVTFTVTVEEYELQSMCEKELSEVFERSQTEGKVGTCPEVNKKQRLILQQGLNQTIQNACDEIYGLFPTLQKDLEGAVAELNKVLCDAEEQALELCDLE